MGFYFYRGHMVDATLVIGEDGKAVKKRGLHFYKGKLDKIEMPDGTLERLLQDGVPGDALLVHGLLVLPC